MVYQNANHMSLTRQGVNITRWIASAFSSSSSFSAFIIEHFTGMYLF